MSTRRLARNAAASVAQVLLSAAALFLMYRLLLSYLSIEQIGLWALVIGSTAVARLSEMGLGAGVLRFVAGDIANGERDRAAQTISMAAICAAGLVAVVALAIYPIILPLLLKGTPAALHGNAVVLLRAALVSVVLTAVANVFCSAIDGCQRIDLRAGLQVSSNLAQLLFTLLILPRMGLSGLGLVQIAQAVFLLVAAAIIMLVQVASPLSAYFRLDTRRLKELFAYGGGLQLSAIGQMLFEPMTKALLTGFSGLALTGYFDMATRIVTQFRSVMVAAYGALVPHVAAESIRDGIDRERIRAIYARSMSLLTFILLPGLAAFAAALPLILTLWVGHFEPVLLAVALLLMVGWGFNMLNPPAYLLFVAVGRLRWNIASHVMIGAIGAGLGVPLGMVLGGPGVLIAAMLGLAAGSLLVLYGFHREFGVSARTIFGLRHIPALLLMAAAIAVSGWFAVSAPAPFVPLAAALMIAVSLLAAAIMWRDPMRLEGMAMLQAYRARRTR